MISQNGNKGPTFQSPQLDLDSAKRAYHKRPIPEDRALYQIYRLATEYKLQKKCARTSYATQAVCHFKLEISSDIWTRDRAFPYRTPLKLQSLPVIRNRQV